MFNEMKTDVFNGGVNMLKNGIGDFFSEGMEDLFSDKENGMFN